MAYCFWIGGPGSLEKVDGNFCHPKVIFKILLIRSVIEKGLKKSSTVSWLMVSTSRGLLKSWSAAVLALSQWS